ncbi:hypothetical protein Lal_00039032 [Lupinus albus]|uniref:Putative ribonuclease H-like domain-containing protein n=1 Tax=Lupinus albus TaxID=3870 RepID=A0A6A4NLW1_LUPAL|nr:putative ribonuclease H-like domain-containing protein [Lupinus albus]KAF1882385.1 hypothetical protein Lal_00039032 [Lupinus albus]
MLGIINILRCQKLTHNPVSQFIRYLHKEPIKVTWEKPVIGCTKLNFDGSCKWESGKASIGGVVRNHNAEFMLGYAESIGEANSTIAEIIALRRGLELVLENGWNNNIWLEGDYKTLVEIIEQKRQVRCMEMREHISQIYSILPWFNNIFASHIYREGNRVADKFAKMGHHLHEPRIWRNVPPYEVSAIMKEEAQGKIVLRNKGL